MKFQYIISTLLLIFTLAINKVADAQNVAYVTNTSNAGIGSLRSALSNGADTVIIDVAGTLNLTASLELYNDVDIVGPSAVHFTIEIGNLLNSKGIFSFNGKKLNLSGVTITGGQNSVRPFYIYSSNDTPALVVEDCLFEANQLTGGFYGGVIYVSNSNFNPIIKFNRCSFFDNSMNPSIGNNNKGGAIAVNKGRLKVYNCTFNANHSTLVGAIYAGSNTDVCKVINNTFVGNTVTEAFNPVATTDLLTYAQSNEIRNNIFKGSSSSSSTNPPYQDLSSFNPYVNSVNNYTNYYYTPSTPIGVSETANLKLKPLPTTDGFGLKYFLFTDHNSSCIDTDNTTSLVGKYDARHSWRKMYGKTDFSSFSGSNSIDAGAVEYSPFRVTNNSSSIAGNFNEVAENYTNNSSILTGRHTIVFEVTPMNNRVINLTSPIYLSNFDLIINGFSQKGSRVPGPKNNSGVIQNGIMGVEINGSSLTAPQSTISILLSDNSEIYITGLSLVGNSNGNGLRIQFPSSGDPAYVSLEGNHIGVSLNGQTVSSNFNGIYSNAYVSGGNPSNYRTNIGKPIFMMGHTHNARNIITGNSYSQITTTTSDSIVNNFIGLNSIGQSVTNLMTQGISFKQMNDSYNYPLIIGEGNHGFSNYFGSIDTVVYIQKQASFISNYKVIVNNNSFGFEFDNVNPAANTTAIFLDRCDSSIIINNQIGNCTKDAIALHNSSYSWVKNNRIGISKSFSSAPIDRAGIGVYGSAGLDDPMYTGNELFNVGTHNVLEFNKIYNCIEGIKYDLIQFTPSDPTPQTSLRTFFNDTIKRNIIGIDTSASVPNIGNSIGIYFGDSTQGVTVLRNIIALNTNDGITIQNTNENEYIQITRNKIYNNYSLSGIGIDLGNDYPSIGTNISNLGILPPTISGAIYCNESGNDSIKMQLQINVLNTTHEYKIEFFHVDSDNQEGAIFIRDTILSPNYFSVNGPHTIFLSFLVSNQFIVGESYVTTLTESGTEPENYLGVLTTYNVASTSEFSAPFTVNTFAPSFTPLSITTCPNELVAITVNQGAISNVSSTSGSNGTFLNRQWLDNNIINSTDITLTVDSLGCSVENTTSITVINCPDSDGDGVIDIDDLDDDNDGITDVVENQGTTDLDSDNDGIFNRLDIDSDNDGIFDIIEAGGIDTNGDGQVDYPQGNASLMLDNDNNGLTDGPVIDIDLDGIADIPIDPSVTGAVPIPTPDSDNDSYPNFIDIDSDNDGIIDLIEAQTSSPFIPLSGGSTNGQGIDNIFFSGGITPINTDTDGTPDYIDNDSDDDGLSDNIETYTSSSLSGNDTDGDGLDDIFDNFSLSSISLFSAGNSSNGGQVPFDFPDNNSTTPELDWRESCISRSTLNITSCTSYTAPSGNQTYLTSAFFTDTITNSIGCDSIITITLTINTTPTGDTTATACESFFWHGIEYTSSSNTITYPYPTINTCDSIVTLDLTIIENDITLIVDALICEGDEVLFEFQSDQDIDLISWSTTNENGVVANENQVLISNPTIGLYNLKPKIETCYFDFNVTIELEENCLNEITTNTFNPNDLLEENQFFNIDLEAINNGEENVVTIYNRWGDIIYKSSNYDNKGVVWRGNNALGLPLPEGTYFYTVDLSTNEDIIKGWVYLNK